MGNTTGRITKIKDDYHAQLLEVVGICDGAGLCYPGEMNMLCRAMRFQHARMTQDREAMQDVDGPDELDRATPAGRILEMVMGTSEQPARPTIREHLGHSRPAEKVEQRGSYDIVSGELPKPPRGVRSCRGPSVAELRALPVDRFIRVKPGEVKLSTLKLRISQQVNRPTRDTERPVRLICWEKEDGEIIVRHA